MSWAVLPPALLLPLLAWGARRWYGSWSAPGAFFAVAWALFTWLALVVAPDFKVWPVAVWVIVGSVLAVNLGAVVGAALWTPVRLPTRAAPAAPSGIRALATLGAALGLLAVALLMRSLGQGIGLFFSPAGLAEIGKQLSGMRYESGYVEPLPVRVLMTGTYLAVMLGGCWAGLAPGRGRQFAVWGGFVPAFAFSALTTARAGVLFCLVLWLGSFLAAGVAAQRSIRDLLPRRALLWGGIAIPGLFTGAVLLQLSRYGLGLDGLLYVLDRLRIWIAGYLAGFAIWLHGSAETLGSSAGAFTFAGVFNLLGISTRTIGLYADFVIVRDGYESNIYTAFRGIFEDFGIVGGGATLVLFGTIAGLAHGGVRRGQVIWLPVLALFYGFVLFSHITSVLNYNSIILAWVVFALALPAASISFGLRAPTPR